jgi:hypothetical protein
MADPPKKAPRLSNPGRFNDLVKSQKASNEKNHRLYGPQSSQRKTNDSQQEKQNSNENDKSSPKPLLDCLQPGPLLTSKPYEKSMAQRRRRNKPFDHENLGRKFCFFFK